MGRKMPRKTIGMAPCHPPTLLPIQLRGKLNVEFLYTSMSKEIEIEMVCFSELFCLHKILMPNGFSDLLKKNRLSQTKIAVCIRKG